MRTILAVSMIALFAGGTAFAQTSASPAHHVSAMKPPPGQSWPKPVDHGPYTPQANAAYQGGGMILEGQPGGPPPRAQAMPSGQMPTTKTP